jgi:hypothetical protein
VPLKKDPETYAEILLDLFSDVAMTESDIDAIAFYAVSHARHREVVRRLRVFGRSLDTALDIQLENNGLDYNEMKWAKRLDPPQL